MNQEQVQHQANKWIEEQWMGKEVRQVQGIPELIGRTGKVGFTMWDENGALHCKVDGPGGEWWCPASLLETEDKELPKQISTAWVLNQLAGMSFPTQGGAYDFIKKCLSK